MIKIICRDVNGKRFEIDVKEYEVDEIKEKIAEDDEILFVYYNQQLIWCGLGKTIGLTTENLTGFFA